MLVWADFFGFKAVTLAILCFYRTGENGVFMNRVGSQKHVPTERSTKNEICEDSKRPGGGGSIIEFTHRRLHKFGKDLRNLFAMTHEPATVAIIPASAQIVSHYWHRTSPKTVALHTVTNLSELAIG